MPQRLMLQQPPAPIGIASKVLCLTQVVTEDELKDDEDYEDILADMKTECGKFGNFEHTISLRFCVYNLSVQISAIYFDFLCHVYV